MTRYPTARTMVPNGILLAVLTTLLPFQPAFGEGGARCDVVRHGAEGAAENAGPVSLSRQATFMDPDETMLRKGTYG